MRHPFLVAARRAVLLVALAASIVATPAVARADGGWEKMDEENGIVAYKKEVPGSSVIAFRGVAVVDAPIERVASVVLDESRGAEWMKDVVSNKISRKISETEYVVYTHYKTPFPLTDRDFVTDTKIAFDPSLKVTIKLRATNDPSAPETSYVRARIESGSWVLTPIENGAKTRVEAELHADPMGAVPDFIVNMVQKGWPIDTLAGLRTQVAKPDIKILPQVTAAVAAAKAAAAPPPPSPDAPPPAAPNP